MAVCATPTTMMATLAAISSVFRSFRIFLPRESGAPSSIGSGGGIVEGIGAGIGAGIGGSEGGRRVELRFGRNVLGGLLERPFEPGARLAAERLRHLHRRVEISRLGGIARGGDGGRLAAGFRGHRPGMAERGLGGGDAGRGRSGLDARGAAAGLERRVGRQIGIDRLALGAARHLPRRRPRWGRSAAERLVRAAAARMPPGRAPAACMGAAGRRTRRLRIISSGDCAVAATGTGAAAGASGAGRVGAAGAGLVRPAARASPREPPLRISSR